MNLSPYRFCDLNSLIDRVLDLFEQWEEHQQFRDSIDDDTLQRLKLAVHEWLANLVQHAHFPDESPEIVLHIWPNGERVYCVIEDNSAGFDLDAQLSARREVLKAFPERGMGLLIIKACTENLSYKALDDHRHRLELSVSPTKDPWPTFLF
jgi:serine/threonine-protein kinase RsbW